MTYSVKWSLVDQQKVESKAKSHHKYDKDYAETEECFQDVEEHDDINAQFWELSDITKKIQPSQGKV